MSGGFFRGFNNSPSLPQGTSAEQDTRFSNKQTKLLKSHKFPPELEHPVSGQFVLLSILFLLVMQAVDGKHIQLTGFLEKNTGKFMKELWGLLLSAQNNSSGVPQQFLDAKQEEMRKRKLENDLITQEIQKRKDKEGREIEQEKQKRMVF
ncbi:hypothetical protein ZIOFF_058120 [Zingiber officinale]|uniref:PWI domain-containing protein n=1 Tax=Zingiber officinale TaxID=94328 RepID=A0A8J5KCP6_ZINOF|nr:hypothetical protein ZIOFF_058120 [Zingiber officinale]